MSRLTFSTRTECERYMADAACDDAVAPALADELITVAHDSGLRYGDDWRAVWDTLAGDSESQFFALIESCRNKVKA